VVLQIWQMYSDFLVHRLGFPGTARAGVTTPHCTTPYRAVRKHDLLSKSGASVQASI
jgi:hypothetical protein